MEEAEEGRELVRRYLQVPRDLVQCVPYNDAIENAFTTGKARRPDIDATIVTSPLRKMVSGGFELVFIDKGSKDGILAGDVFSTLMPNTDDSVNGLIQILKAPSLVMALI